MDRILAFVRLGAGTALFTLIAVDPALAGKFPAPGPALAASLPALALFGAGYWLIRGRRKS
ncbi:MAG TPA: hypothetical protein VK472_01215 [Allosphingosinicella sp.]|nr:hypothetical protein [Allosphingosinicella sp.]